MSRVSIIHLRSNEYDEGLSVTYPKHSKCRVLFNDPPDCPVQEGAWYAVVDGGDSEDCMLEKVSDGKRTTLYFKR